MKRAYFLIVGCLVILHLFSLHASAQTSVQEVFVQGNKNVSEDKIRRIIRLESGDDYSDQAVTEAIKRLFATKEFSDVQAYKEVRGVRALLTFVVKEYTKINEVRFEGNKHVKKDDLGEATVVSEGAFIRPSLLRKDHKAIEDLYKEKGYYRVKVTDNIDVERDKETKRTRNVLVYVVDEGEKVSIKHIDFFGNRVVDSDVIRGIMESKQDHWYRGADFKPKVLDADLEHMALLYREHGFLDIEIVEKELIFSDDGKGLDIFITLKEGTQYYLRSKCHPPVHIQR